jgi:hypothetical protein
MKNTEFKLLSESINRIENGIEESTGGDAGASIKAVHSALRHIDEEMRNIEKGMDVLRNLNDPDADYDINTVAGLWDAADKAWALFATEVEMNGPFEEDWEQNDRANDAFVDAKHDDDDEDADTGRSGHDDWFGRNSPSHGRDNY